MQEGAVDKQVGEDYRQVEAAYKKVLGIHKLEEGDD